MSETTLSTEAPPAGTEPHASAPADAPRTAHPLLATLAERHPALFGAQPLPLKLGIFEDLLALPAPGGAEPYERDALKAALAQHARSTRYLGALAHGTHRHDLTGAPVELLAPEHRYHALVAYYRRKQARTRHDLTPQVKRKMAAAFEASGLSADAYGALVRGQDESINAVLDDTLREASARASRDEALLRAWQSSGQGVDAFADAYGLPRQRVQQALARAGIAPEPGPAPG